MRMLWLLSTQTPSRSRDNLVCSGMLSQFQNASLCFHSIAVFITTGFFRLLMLCLTSVLLDGKKMRAKGYEPSFYEEVQPHQQSQG